MAWLALLTLAAGPAWVREERVEIWAATDGRLFLMVQEPLERRIECVASASGRPIWRFPAAAEFRLDAAWWVGDGFVAAGLHEGRHVLAWVDSATGSVAYMHPSQPAIRGPVVCTSDRARYLEPVGGDAVRLWTLGPNGPQPRDFSRWIGFWRIDRPRTLRLVQGSYLYEPGNGIARLDEDGGVAWSVPLDRREHAFFAPLHIYLLGSSTVRILRASDGAEQARREDAPAWLDDVDLLSLGVHYAGEREHLVLRVPGVAIAVLSCEARIVTQVVDGPHVWIGPWLVVEDPATGRNRWIEMATARREVGAEEVVPVRPSRGGRERSDFVWEPEERVLYLVERGGRSVLGRWQPGQVGLDEREVRTARVADWTWWGDRIWVVDEQRVLHVLDREERTVVEQREVPAALWPPLQIAILRGGVAVLGERGLAWFPQL